MDFKEVILAYETYLMEEGKVESTIDSYVGDIRGFLEFLESKKVSFRGNLTRLYITSYKIHLTENGYSINTINKKINSLHSFNFFLVSKNLCTEKVVYPNKDKIKIARGSEKEIDVFSDEEVERILFYLEDRSRVSIRDKGGREYGVVFVRINRRNLHSHSGRCTRIKNYSIEIYKLYS